MTLRPLRVLRTRDRRSIRPGRTRLMRNDSRDVVQTVMDRTTRPSVSMTPTRPSCFTSTTFHSPVHVRGPASEPSIASEGSCRSPAQGRGRLSRRGCPYRRRWLNLSRLVLFPLIHRLAHTLERAADSVYVLSATVYWVVFHI